MLLKFFFLKYEIRHNLHTSALKIWVLTCKLFFFFIQCIIPQRPGKTTQGQTGTCWKLTPYLERGRSRWREGHWASSAVLSSGRALYVKSPGRPEILFHIWEKSLGYILKIWLIPPNRLLRSAMAFPNQDKWVCEETRILSPPSIGRHHSCGSRNWSGGKV